MNAQATQYVATRVRTRTWNWTDAAVLPLVLTLSILPLLWFGRNWRVPPDGSVYLLEGWNLVSGRGYTRFGDLPQTIRGPIFPGLLGLLQIPLGRDVERLAWAVRLLALANPVLVYLLFKRIAGPVAGLLAAGIVTLLGYSAMFAGAFNIDAPLLTVYLLAVVALLAAARNDSTRLWLLSGVLLGVAILTKETSFVGLPLALVAALLLGGGAREVAAHYAGAALTCLPWWVWVWTQTREIYLVGRLPASLTYPVLGGAVLLVLIGLLLFRLGVPHSLLGTERRRRGAAWLIAAGWVAVLTPLLLSTSRGLIFRDTELWSYFVRRVLGDTPLWYLLPLAAGYALLMALRGHRLWGFYVLLLALQTPVLALVLTQRYAPRQWMLPQTLLYGALAALVVAAIRWAATAERRAHALPRYALAVVLVSALVVATSLQTWALVSDDQRVAVRDPNNQVNGVSLRMGRYIMENVPADQGILATWLYSNQLAWADGMRHRWGSLQHECVTMHKSPEQAPCGRHTTNIYRWPPPDPTIWIQMGAGCDAAALTLDGVMRQMDAAGAEYLLIAREPGYLATLAWVSPLSRSGAFETVYSAYLDRGPTPEEARGLVLLRRTGREFRPQRTRMSANTIENLIKCEQAAHGEGYARAIRETFPHGIHVFGRQQPDTDKAIRKVEEIYKGDV